MSVLAEPVPLRPTKQRVLLRRVELRGSIILHVGEQYGVTDRVLQIAELIAKGPDFKPDVAVGALVVYNQARVFDHFRWGSDGDGGKADILVYPGEHLLGVVTETFLADHPEERRYELQPL